MPCSFVRGEAANFERFLGAYIKVVLRAANDEAAVCHAPCLFGLEVGKLDLTYFGPLGLFARIRPSHCHTSFLKCVHRNDEQCGYVSIYR